MAEEEYPYTQVEKLFGHPLNDIESRHAPTKIFYKGPMKIPLPCPRVSVIGSRSASENGLAEAAKISELLTKNKVTIVSGLAKGIDTVGHTTAVKYGGKTIAVIGTPLNRVYPKENAKLQEELMKNHLVISQYSVNHPTTRKNFVLRNRTMALISDATVIVEAGDSSGSLHQGWEALRIGRPLFICKSIVHDARLTWPAEMIKYGAMKLDCHSDILEYLPPDIPMPDLFH